MTASAGRPLRSRSVRVLLGVQLACSAVDVLVKISITTSTQNVVAILVLFHPCMSNSSPSLKLFDLVY